MKKHDIFWPPTGNFSKIRNCVWQDGGNGDFRLRKCLEWWRFPTSESCRPGKGSGQWEEGGGGAWEGEASPGDVGVLVEEGVEVGGEDGVWQEWTGHWSAGQTQAGAAEPWRTGGTWGGLTRELGRRGSDGAGGLQDRFAVLLAALVTGQNGIHTELQQWPGVA